MKLDSVASIWVAIKWVRVSDVYSIDELLSGGICLTFATPMCCALFPQKASMAVSSLEPAAQVYAYENLF